MTEDKIQGTEELSVEEKAVVGLALAYMLWMGDIVARGAINTLFGEKYQNYKRQVEGPTTVWRWLGESAKRKASAIKNWDPDV